MKEIITIQISKFLNNELVEQIAQKNQRASALHNLVVFTFSLFTFCFLSILAGNK